MPRAALALLLLSGACEPPRDSAAPTDPSAWTDPVYGSLVWVAWEQPDDATISVAYRVDDEDWRETPATARAAGPQEQLLLGLPFDAEVVWEVRSDGAFLGTGTLRTDPAPAALPQVEILASVPELQDPSIRWILGSVDELDTAGTSEATWVFLLDRLGRYVWARRTETGRGTLQAHLANDGRALLLDLDSFWAAFDRGAASQVERVTIDGRIEQVWDTPGLHHPFTEPEPDTIAWGAWGDGSEDLLEIGAGGATRTTWRCDDYRTAVGLPGALCSSNTLNWFPDRGTYLFSFYTTNTVVEIHRDSGESRRWFGEMPGSWRFDPPESQFYWQHGATWTDAGTLLLSTRSGRSEDCTVVREYAPDPRVRTLRQVWSYGEEECLFASVLGEAHRLPGGNTLHNVGNALRLREITPDGQLAWDLTWPDSSVLLRTEPLESLDPLLP
ncbi:MAG: hypothetical protein ABIO70_04000 [Pseudomonadota bacterium]